VHPHHFFLCLLLSFPHHDHHPCLAASSISFLGGIGIALFRLIVALTSLYVMLLYLDAYL